METGLNMVFKNEKFMVKVKNCKSIRSIARCEHCKFILIREGKPTITLEQAEEIRKHIEATAHNVRLTLEWLVHDYEVTTL